MARSDRTKTLMSLYNLSYSEWEKLIDEWIFSERDRAMLKRRLLDGITFDRLSEEFALSVQQTKTIIYKAQADLFKRIIN
jgi:hypothetical protein